MERFENHHTQNHSELRAFYIAVEENIYNPDETIDIEKQELLEGYKKEFLTEMDSKYSVEERNGSEAYHILKGSTVQENKRISPDPIFDDVDSFMKNRLGLIAWGN